MVRLAAAATVAVLADAVALVLTAWILDDMSLELGAFVSRVAIFTVVEMVVTPMIRQAAIKQAPALLGSSALIATLVSLIVTVILTDGMRISGFVGWVLATVMVWGISLVTQLLLPLLIFKKVLGERRRSG